MKRMFFCAIAVCCASASICHAQEQVIDQTQVVGDNWFSPHYWDSSFEIGINGAEGNTQSFNLQSGFDLIRKSEISELAMKLAYAKTTANGIDTQHFARSTWEYDRLFAQGSPWSLYANTFLLYDEFQGFDLRLNSNLGIGYKWWDTEASMFRTRAGIGVTREFGGVRNDFVPEANFGVDYRKQLTDRQKFNITVDYYPAWSDFQDYRLVTNASWELLLDEAANLSLKATVFDTYVSVPDPGIRPNDLKYGLLLLWDL